MGQSRSPCRDEEMTGMSKVRVIRESLVHAGERIMDAAPGIAFGATCTFQIQETDDRHCCGRVHTIELACACRDSRSLSHLFPVLRYDPQMRCAARPGVLKKFSFYPAATHPVLKGVGVRLQALCGKRRAPLISQFIHLI
jgi:hypothetical protein